MFYKDAFQNGRLAYESLINGLNSFNVYADKAVKFEPPEVWTARFLFRSLTQSLSLCVPGKSDMWRPLYWPYPDD